MFFNIYHREFIIIHPLTRRLVDFYETDRPGGGVGKRAGTYIAPKISRMDPDERAALRSYRNYLRANP